MAFSVRLKDGSHVGGRERHSETREMARVEVDNLDISLTAPDGRVTHVLGGVSFTAEQNEFVCIVGPSGSGKTTLLNILAGLVTDYSGHANMLGDHKESRPTVGYVFQTPRLLNWRTLLQNVTFGLRATRVGDTELRDLALDQLRVVGLDRAASHYPLSCSEGEKARVGIARALAIDPDILLMDEPYSQLDELSARRLRTDILRIWAERKKLVIFVTHNVAEAVYLADRVYVLSARPAKTSAIVRIELPRPRRPTDPAALLYQDRILGHIGVDQP